MRVSDPDVSDNLAPNAGLSIDDWECLLAAVTARLRSAVAEAPTHLRNGAGTTLQANVLECVEALDQLHDALRKSFGEAQPTTIISPEAADRGASAQP